MELGDKYTIFQTQHFKINTFIIHSSAKTNYYLHATGVDCKNIKMHKKKILTR